MIHRRYSQWINGRWPRGQYRLPAHRKVDQAMIVGIPKETKTHEYRVSMTPVGVDELVRRGHTVLIETESGLGSGIANE